MTSWLLPTRRDRAVLAALLAAACVLPTERGGELRVEIDSLPDLLQGEVLQLTGRVLDAGGAPVPNAEIRFDSSNPLVAAVSEDGVLLATGVGDATITASAVDFAEALEANRPAKIHDLLEVDSIRPAVTRFGDTLQIFGVGLSPAQLFLITVGDVPTIVRSYTPADPAEPNRFGRLTVWVPPPAPRNSRVGLLGVEGLAFSPDSAFVQQRDIYEPNDILPRDLGTLPQGMFNPALAFEGAGRLDSIARTDWYRFENTGALDRTLFLSSTTTGPESYTVLVTDSLAFDGVQGQFDLAPVSWTVGPDFQTCGGFVFAPEVIESDSVVVALRALSPGTYHVLAAYDKPGAYQMAILSEYRSVLPPDAAEENDFCDLARPISFAAGTRGYTIDNPHDVDWFRFTVPAAQDGQGFGFTIVAADSTADLDAYILRDELPDSLPVVGGSKDPGATENATAALTAGDYFFVVVDFAGVPTNYQLTPAAGVVVTTPPESAAPEAKKNSRGKRWRAWLEAGDR